MTDLLRKMTSDKLSLFHVLECVANQWKLLVGTSPISRFVAQLCKLTLGWTMTSSSMENELEISHIEFSKLNESSSSSGSASPTLPRPPKLPVSSSPIHNNNHIKAPKLPPKGMFLKVALSCLLEVNKSLRVPNKNSSLKISVF